ncbi:MAG: hypothetical protein CM15mP86_09310 [Gammaproteobacteria bacterium]|nr:MAG: hypothetical protein CM15mP86_09310 [Gammaproteobacteria bacterium]
MCWILKRRLRKEANRSYCSRKDYATANNGKASFITLQDMKGQIQAYVRSNDSQRDNTKILRHGTLEILLELKVNFF